MRRSLTFTRFLGWLIASEVTLLDQWSKALVLGLAHNTDLPLEITSFFGITLTHNRGISFGMLRDMQQWMPLFLTAATSVVAVILAVWMMRAKEKYIVLAVGGIIGGAVGNSIDRARLGAVTDFLDFHAGLYHWPAFNLADSAIFVGVVILIFGGIVYRRPEAPSVEKPDHAHL